MPPLSLFISDDAVKLLWNKFIVIIGDSIQRGIYKDLIALLQGNEYLSAKDLKAKGEFTFMNDTLLEGGFKGEMKNGINYREVRQFKTDYHLVRFYFVTRVYNKYWEEVIFPDLSDQPSPDVVIMNSCLWDISRYEKRGMQSYKKNVALTFEILSHLLSPETLILWNTALPVARKIKGGFLLPELQYLSETIRLDVLEGNFYAKELAKAFEIDVLDLHYFFRHQMHRMVSDGVHWNFVAHRRITNMILAHIAIAWGVGCPRGRGRSSPLPPAPKPPAAIGVQPTFMNDLYINFDTIEAPAKKSQLDADETKVAVVKPQPVKVVISERSDGDSVKSSSPGADRCNAMLEVPLGGVETSKESHSTEQVSSSGVTDLMKTVITTLAKGAAADTEQVSSSGLSSLMQNVITTLAKGTSADTLPSTLTSQARSDGPRASVIDKAPVLATVGATVGANAKSLPPVTALPERTVVERKTPPLISNGLLDERKVVPITQTGMNPQQCATSQPTSSPQRLKSRSSMSKRPSSRFAPYAPCPRPQARPPPLPRDQPPIPQMPLPYAYSRPQYPYEYTSRYGSMQPHYNPGSNFNWHRFASDAYAASYGGMGYDQAARMRQRVAAERNMEIVRGLLKEDMLNLQ